MALTARLLQDLAGSPCRLLAAPMDLKLSEHDVVQPDLLVVGDPQQIRPTHIEGPPRLACYPSPIPGRGTAERERQLQRSSGLQRA